MMRWAVEGRFKDVGFFCCCVDPAALQTCAEFETNYFVDAPPSLLNGFVDPRSRRDFPNFKVQLGCSGFVVFDGNRKVKVSATLPWLQHREGGAASAAFRDVERHLRELGHGAVSSDRSPEPELGAGAGRRSLSPRSLEALVVASVGHRDMDAEHDKCAAALHSLREKLTVASLRVARSEISAHFRHEEQLLRAADFGAARLGMIGFSPLEGHVKDHERIVGLADEALANLQAACENVEGNVPKRVATQLAQAFVEHAELYDSLYVGKV